MATPSIPVKWHCDACGKHKYQTPRTWRCKSCPDYLLCESCYQSSTEMPASGSQHTPDHTMAPSPKVSKCDCCYSHILKRRWYCLECFDFDLCDICYGEVDAAHMPPQHSKEHRMIAIEVILNGDFTEEMNRLGLPKFTKPVDPRWACRILEPESSLGIYSPSFQWKQRKSFVEAYNSEGPETDDSHCKPTPSAMPSISPSTLFEVENHINRTLNLGPSLTTSGNRSYGKTYKVFLSHTGAQKDFVEQLYLDLRAVNHFGIFFDKDDGSLPKGERFPGLIFDAVKHCELVVLILSDEFFSRKWPMLELATAIEARKTRPELKILPVFYKLSVEELKQKERQQSYFRSWEKMTDTRSSLESDIRQWKEALKILPSFSGLGCQSNTGDVALRKDIVEQIFKVVKPDVLRDVSDVQGGARMSKMIVENLEVGSGEEQSAASVRLVGLYGMGGSGKTTITRVVCNNMRQKYLGKVCHIELGSMDPLLLQKQVLGRIMHLQADYLSSVFDVTEALQLLKQHAPHHKACLVIDNVSNDQASIKEAKGYLHLPFHEGSMVFVTARSLAILTKLKVKWKICMKTPSLLEQEAKALFIHHAECATSGLSKLEEEALEKLMKHCCFKVNDAIQEYHPLALRALGTRAGIVDTKEWLDLAANLKYDVTGNVHPVFSILRSSYDTLSSECQRMFLDLALSRSGIAAALSDVIVSYRWSSLYGMKNEFQYNAIMQELQAKALVDFPEPPEFGMSVAPNRFYIHDLYREFAKMEVKSEEIDHLESCCLSRSEQQRGYRKKRLRIHNEDLTSLRTEMLCNCSEADLLILENCRNLRSLDVEGMHELRGLEISECPQLTELVVKDVAKLQYIHWDGFTGHYPSLAGLGSLRALRLENSKPVATGEVVGSEILDFSGCPILEKFRVVGMHPLPAVHDFGKMKFLSLLVVPNCRHVRKFEGLEALQGLVHLWLGGCSNLTEFPALSNFVNLEVLLLRGAVLLKELHGFASLGQLRELNLDEAKLLKTLPGIETCTRLQRLSLSYTSISEFSWISGMPNLEVVDLSGTSLRVFPDCSDLHHLKWLMLKNCQALESLGNVGIVSALLGLDVENCPSLRAVPLLDGSALVEISIGRTQVVDVSTLDRYVHLRRIYCRGAPITALPDLSNLVNLTVIEVSGCPLTRMDNTTSLPALECLYASYCANLVALPDLRSSKNLKFLNVMHSPLLDPNLVKLPGHGSVHDGAIESDHGIQDQEEETDSVVSHSEEDGSDESINDQIKKNISDLVAGVNEVSTFTSRWWSKIVETIQLCCP